MNLDLSYYFINILWRLCYLFRRINKWMCCLIEVCIRLFKYKLISWERNVKFDKLRNELLLLIYWKINLNDNDKLLVYFCLYVCKGICY